MTKKEAKIEAEQVFNNGIDLEDDETKQDWIDVYVEALLEDERNG